MFQDLTDFQSDRLLFLGDFNAILGAHERHGGSAPQRQACEDFCDFILDCSLLEVPMTGLNFSWSSWRVLGLVESKLDRALVSEGFLGVWENITARLLPRSSDHAPLVVVCSDLSSGGPRSFHFWNMWTLHEGFIEVVSDSWKAPVVASNLLHKVMLKLKRLNCLRHWNFEVFGCTYCRIGVYSYFCAIRYFEWGGY